MFSQDVKALPRVFLCIFSSLYLPEETCFQQGGSSAVEGTSQAVLGSSSDQRKLPASLSLFLKKRMCHVDSILSCPFPFLFFSCFFPVFGGSICWTGEEGSGRASSTGALCTGFTLINNKRAFSRNSKIFLLKNKTLFFFKEIRTIVGTYLLYSSLSTTQNICFFSKKN